MHVRVGSVFIFGLCLLHLAGAASFEPSVIVSEGTTAGENCLAQFSGCADLDGDGNADFFLATGTQAGCTGEQKLQVFEHSTTLPVAGVNVLTTTSLDGIRVLAKDYDSDGDVDLLLTDFNGGVAFNGDHTNKLRVLTNSGAGVFTETVIADAFSQFIAVTWANVDNTGDIDIVGLGTVYGSPPAPAPPPTVMCKSYLAGFSSSMTPAVGTAPVGAGGYYAYHLAAADLNGDGFDDLVAAYFATSSGYHIVLNSGATPFYNFDTGAHLFSSNSPLPSGHALADVNADGQIDCVATANSVAAISLFIHSGVVTSASTIYPTATDITNGITGGYAAFVTLALVDDDAFVDLLFVVEGMAYIRFHSGVVTSAADIFNGPNVLLATLPALGTPRFTNPSVCDFNRDGSRDIVIASSSAAPFLNKVYGITQVPPPVSTTATGSATATGTGTGPSTSGATGSLLNSARSAYDFPIAAVVGGVLGGCCCCLLVLLALVAWQIRKCPHCDEPCQVSLGGLSASERRSHIEDFAMHTEHFASQLKVSKADGGDVTDVANYRCKTCVRLVKTAVWAPEGGLDVPVAASASAGSGPTSGSDSRSGTGSTSGLTTGSTSGSAS